MADVQTVLDACDEEYTHGLRANVIAHQQQFRPEHGRFWQGLRTHQVLPADGNAVRPDTGIGQPSDEDDGWPNSIRQLTTLQALSVHKYVATEGQGFLIQREVTINGDAYRTTEDIGGFVGSQPWALVPPSVGEAS